MITGVTQANGQVNQKDQRELVAVGFIGKMFLFPPSPTLGLLQGLKNFAVVIAAITAQPALGPNGSCEVTPWQRF